MLNHLTAFWKSALQPMHQSLRMTRYVYGSAINPLQLLPWSGGVDRLLAFCEDMTTFGKPPQFNITQTEIQGEEVAIEERDLLDLPYMTLKHFAKLTPLDQPKILIVAPLSGHYAALLRNTVTGLLAKNDIYITDWKNIRDVPVEQGRFHFDHFVDYLIDCLQLLGADTHIVTVCQPAIPALIATAYLAQHHARETPPSLTFISGPVDTTIDLSQIPMPSQRPDLDWYQSNALFAVPKGYAGAGQQVFPGFLQLMGLLSLHNFANTSNHRKTIRDLLQHAGDFQPAEMIRFFDEYFAMQDLPADYFLETLERVFLNNELANGKATYRGLAIDCSLITQTGLLTVEGGEDQICRPGQTHAAHQLCSQIPAAWHQQLTLEHCGHYTTWNGKYYDTEVAPTITRFIKSINQQRQSMIAEPELAQVG